jgi:hypothetical protein
LEDTADKRIDQLFEKLLVKYPKGISASSNNKYEQIQAYFAELLNLQVSDIYVTGATRSSNFGVRFTQGNQRATHTLLGVGFARLEDDEKIEEFADSCVSTCRKFVETNSAGATLEVIAIFVVDSANHSVLKRIVAVEGSTVAKQLANAFPHATLIEFPRVAELPSVPLTQARTFSAPSQGQQAIDLDLCASMHEDFNRANFQCDSGVIQRMTVAVLTKRFLILAGLTGSGKTLLARAFSRWLAQSDEQIEVLPVGADWTNNEKILGYPDVLNDKKYERTKVIDLIEKAEENPNLPYFLILDEMNLSHVERYFSDFLSGLESGEAIRLHDGLTDRGVPSSIKIPSNLFIIGTVNVDETTYMFSPKVLDRANVIEFMVTEQLISRFLDAPQTVDFSLIDGKGARYAEDFVKAAGSEPALDAALREKFKSVILKVFDLFNSEGAPFAQRTVREMARFMAFYALLVEEDAASLASVDAQVLQKIMPKLHGDMRRLKRLLYALGTLTVQNWDWDYAQSPPTLRNGEVIDAAVKKSANEPESKDPLEWEASEQPGLPLTLQKVQRMLAQLRRDGFTSYIEA